MLVKKNIVIDSEIWTRLKILSRLDNDRSISDIIREAVGKLLDKKRKDIDFQLRLQCGFVDDAEQRDIEKSLAGLSAEAPKVARKRRL